MQENTELVLKNSIIHLAGNATNYWARAGAFVFGAGRGNGKIQSSGNIFICDVHPSTAVLAGNTNTQGGFGSSKDRWTNNVYILLKGAGISWADQQFYGNDWKPNIFSFEDWKRQSGQDQNSLFFDLRNDPRGLKAIFVNPDQGDYTLANTPEGRQVKALKAGMTNPITCFLRKPTYEEAAAMIQNEEALTVNSCKDPCIENLMRASASFQSTIINNRQAQLSWNLGDSRNIVRCELQRGEGFFNFKTIATVPLSASTLQTYLDHIQPNKKYLYRLAVLNNKGGQCFSDVITLQTRDVNTLTVFPNPSKGQISISLNGYRGGALVTISDMSGRQIQQRAVLLLNNTLSFDLGSLAAGVYVLTVKTSTGTHVQKFSLN